MSTDVSELSTVPFSPGCTGRRTDSQLDIPLVYDFKYIEQTVYRLSRSNSGLGQSVKQALMVIEKAYQDFGDSVALAFNGGKDCTVLLHLVAAVISRLGHQKPLRTVFITCPNPFPHVDEFAKVCIQRYQLDCRFVPGPMKEALACYLDSTLPKPKGIFVGIRRSDPFAEHLTHFDATDEGWPEFIRIQPILDWTYKDIWDFLIQLQVPYCSLYDQGYTSLGSMENTQPNPDLLDEEQGIYKPAFMLTDESRERGGRRGSSPK